MLDASFVDAVRLIEQCCGSVIVSGMGKAGLIGQKIAATLSSTGTPSHFVHPAEAIHGDLGRIRNSDLVLLAGDASGGRYASHPTLRRVGAALSQWDSVRHEQAESISWALGSHVP